MRIARSGVLANSTSSALTHMVLSVCAASDKHQLSRHQPRGFPGSDVNGL
jgi:hypothetical protein